MTIEEFQVLCSEFGERPVVISPSNAAVAYQVAMMFAKILP